MVYDYRLDDWDSVPGRANDFSSSRCFQTRSETHPASCPMGTRGHFPGVKSGLSETLTNHPPLVPRSRTSKVKQSRYTPWWRLGGEEYSFYSFTTSALDGGEWSPTRPGHALPPGKGTLVPIVQEAGWVPEPVWTQALQEKLSYPCRRSNLDLPVVQSVVRHYTDWATPTPQKWVGALFPLSLSSCMVCTGQLYFTFLLTW
jgi:hypothetical protein